MKAVAVLALSLGLVAASPSPRHAEIAARKAAEEHELWQRQQGCTDFSGYDPNCRVPGSPNQGVADTIYRVARGRGVSDRVMLATFEAALVESNCNNINCGHDDSIGVFQQRPCVRVWGTYNQIMNVTHATNKFLDAVTQCERNHGDYDAGRLAQCAQVSQVPNAYAEARGRAQTLLNTTRQRNGGSSNTGGNGATNVGSNPSGGSSSSGSCTRNTVRAGETGNQFASRNGVSWQAVVDLNPGLNQSGTNLRAGQAYCVRRNTSGGTTNVAKPPASSSGGGNCSKQTSAVRSGDTGSAFAGRNGVSYAQLQKLNPSRLNTSGTNLRVGEKYCLN